MKAHEGAAQTRRLAQALDHHRAGRLEPAALLYRSILADDPNHADALHFSGVVAWQTGHLERAAQLIMRSLVLAPNQAQAHSNLGNVLRQAGRLDEAAQSYGRAVDLDPDNADLWINRGVALRELARLDDAEAAYRRALALRPQSAVVHNNLGNVLADQLRLEEALIAFEDALTLDPRCAAAWSNRGNALLAHQPEESLASCERALELQPDFARAQLFRGNALLVLHRFAEAAEALSKACAALPDETFLPGKLLFARQSACDWLDHAALVERIEARVLAREPAALPWELLLSSDNAGVHQAASRTFVSRTVPAQAPLWTGEIYAHERIRIAYLSADFRNHATTYLMARLFELHDTSRFEIDLVSLAPSEPDEMRQRLLRAPVNFIEAGEMSDAAVATLLHGRRIDIAMDLQGLSGNSRPGILARRPAPLQVSYLGYPGTMGAPFIDYLIADSTVIPPGDEAHYDERIVRLPGSYQVNDDARPIAHVAPTRRVAGLPEHGFVFCCFNKSAKITPAVFEVWTRLLARVPGSVLWLLGSNADAVGNLRREAGARGIAAERLVFAPRVPQADHLARHRLADLALDTVPYNAHTTASDALWAGVPMVSCLGRSFAGRVGASLLRALGLPELVTDHLAAYEDLAVELATTPVRFAGLRRELQVLRDSRALFDSARFRDHLESAWVTIVERQRAGLPAASLDVAPGGA